MDKDKKEVFETLNETLEKLLSQKPNADREQIDLSSHFEIEMIAKTTETLLNQIEKLQTTIYRKQTPPFPEPLPYKGSKVRPHRLKRKR